MKINVARFARNNVEKWKTFLKDLPTPIAFWFCFITSFLKDWCVWTWCCQKGWLRGGHHRDGSCNSDCGSTRHQSWWHISFLTSTPSFFLLAKSLYKIPVKDGPSRSHKKHETFASQWHYWTDFQPHFILSLHCRKILRIFQPLYIYTTWKGIQTSFGLKAAENYFKFLSASEAQSASTYLFFFINNNRNHLTSNTFNQLK